MERVHSSSRVGLEAEAWRRRANRPHEAATPEECSQAVGATERFLALLHGQHLQKGAKMAQTTMALQHAVGAWWSGENDGWASATHSRGGLGLHNDAQQERAGTGDDSDPSRPIILAARVLGVGAAGVALPALGLLNPFPPVLLV